LYLYHWIKLCSFFSKARLDRNEIEKRLRLELEGLDIDKIALEVRNEVNEKAKKRYAETCF
jgi:hypothetical protein